MQPKYSLGPNFGEWIANKPNNYKPAEESSIIVDNSIFEETTNPNYEVPYNWELDDEVEILQEWTHEEWDKDAPTKAVSYNITHYGIPLHS